MIVITGGNERSSRRRIDIRKETMTFIYDVVYHTIHLLCKTSHFLHFWGCLFLTSFGRPFSFLFALVGLFPSHKNKGSCNTLLRKRKCLEGGEGGCHRRRLEHEFSSMTPSACALPTSKMANNIKNRWKCHFYSCGCRDFPEFYDVLRGCCLSVVFSRFFVVTLSGRFQVQACLVTERAIL